MTRWILLGLAAAAGAAGCGPTGQPSMSTPVPATGKATFADGSPVANVQLYFLPTDAPAPAYGKTQADGSFTLTTYENKEGICKGKYLVYVRPIGVAPAELAKSAPAVKKTPERYKDDAGKSPLEVEVTSSTSTLDLKIETK